MSLVGYCVLDNFSNYILWVLLLEIIEVVCSEIFMLEFNKCVHISYGWTCIKIYCAGS